MLSVEARGGSTGAASVTLRRDGRTEDVVVEQADSYPLELENLADAIDGRAPALLGREDAVGQARAIDALYRSAERHADRRRALNVRAPRARTRAGCRG